MHETFCLASLLIQLDKECFSGHIATVYDTYNAAEAYSV